MGKLKLFFKKILTKKLEVQSLYSVTPEYYTTPEFLTFGKKLLGIILGSIILICFMVISDANADETDISIIQNGISDGDLVLQFHAEDIFTDKVTKYLDRGFTIKIEYKIELWHSRRLWFDQLDTQRSLSYQINLEPIAKRYICLKSQQGQAIESKLDKKLDEIIRWTTQPEPPLNITSTGWLDYGASYYYNIEITVATLTSENIKHLQSWLGEFGEKGEEPSTLAKTTFRVARDFISSRNNKNYTTRTEKFRLRDLPTLR